MGRFAHAGASSSIPIIAVIGELWLDSVSMTIVPLVVALLITGIASALSTAAMGSMTARLLALFVFLLASMTLLIGSAAWGLLASVPIPTESLAAIRAGLGGAGLPPAQNVTVLDWIGSIIPANPMAAAADGAMVQLVVFSIIFALALTRIAADARDRITRFFESVANAMLVIIDWALLAAPVGVFALAFVLGAKGGLSVAGALAHYILFMVTLLLLVIGSSYVLANLLGAVRGSAFAKAVLPAQAVAASTQSSLASLPVMVESAEALNVPKHVSGIVLPMAVTTFRITSPTANFAIAVYCAHIFGVELDVATLATGFFIAILMTWAGTGVPSQAGFFTTLAPICVAMGVPLEALPIFLAIETIPDIFKTVGNVTADVAVTTVVDRHWRFFTGRKQV